MDVEVNNSAVHWNYLNKITIIIFKWKFGGPLNIDCGPMIPMLYIYDSIYKYIKVDYLSQNIIRVYAVAPEVDKSSVHWFFWRKPWLLFLSENV